MSLIEKRGVSRKHDTQYDTQSDMSITENPYGYVSSQNTYLIKKLYIPGKSNMLSMGGETTILGTAELPFQPTDLEYFADRIACDKDISLDIITNSLHSISLKYLFKKEGSKGGLYIAYELICHSDIGSKDIKTANEAFKCLWHAGDFEEQMLFRNKNKRVSILRNKNTPCGEYTLIQGSNVCGPYTLGTIETLCFI